MSQTVPSPRPAAERSPRPRRGADRVTIVLPWDLDPRMAAFPRTPADGQLLVLESRGKPSALPVHRQKSSAELRAIRVTADAHRATLVPLDTGWTFDDDGG